MGNIHSKKNVGTLSILNIGIVTCFIDFFIAFVSFDTLEDDGIRQCSTYHLTHKSVFPAYISVCICGEEEIFSKEMYTAVVFFSLILLFDNLYHEHRNSKDGQVKPQKSATDLEYSYY